MQVIIANIIFAWPLNAYLGTILIPFAGLAALSAEWAVYRYHQTGLVSQSRTLATVFSANLVSWFVGYLAVGALSDNVSVGELDGLAGWIASFIVACLLSIGLEYAFLRVMGRWLPCPSLGRVVVSANVLSYIVLAITVALYFNVQL